MGKGSREERIRVGKAQKRRRKSTKGIFNIAQNRPLNNLNMKMLSHTEYRRARARDRDEKELDGKRAL